MAIITCAVASVLLLAVHGVFADITINSGTQNCDANAVIYCGATSASQLVSKYNGGDGHNSAQSIHNIYDYFGITSSDIQAMPQTAVAGVVTKSGQVYVGSQLVASNALTAGRQNIAGSTPENVGGTIFYTRAPSVSFLENSLTAYIVMSHGQFQYAILSSCGNPVKATPAPAPTPTPKPTPTPPPAPRPTGQCSNLSLSQASNDPREVTATVNYIVTNGASLSGVTYNWGDGDTTPSSTQTTLTHTFQQDGTYTVQATLTFTSSPSIPSSTCQSPITAMTSLPTCDELTTQTDGDTVTITGFNTTANDGTFTNATLDWGNGSQQVISQNLTGLTHTYTASSTSNYTITATGQFSVNGQNYSASSPNCQKQVSFSPPIVLTSAPTPTPPTPTPPAAVTSLVNTGPGNVLGIFTLATILGTLGYRRMLSRHIGRN